jgi:hypothetical protein
MADRKVSLEELLKHAVPAKSLMQVNAEKAGASKLPKHAGHKLRKESQARLLAQEYVRNGFRFGEAYKTVTGAETMHERSMHKLLGPNVDLFMEEVRRMVEASDIDKEKALNILWAMVNMSVLDFYDEHGNVLSIRELKGLPRVMQIMIHEVKVKAVMVPLKDDTGKVMLDDNGSPYLTRVEQVTIRIPEKMAAINQLALLMRWTGPMVNLNVNLSVGQLMIEADERKRRIENMYDGATGKIIDQ